VAAAERDLSIQDMLIQAVEMYLNQENPEAAHARTEG
jgi:hypothetical protein